MYRYFYGNREKFYGNVIVGEEKVWQYRLHCFSLYRYATRPDSILPCPALTCKRFVKIKKKANKKKKKKKRYMHWQLVAIYHAVNSTCVYMQAGCHLSCRKFYVCLYMHAGCHLSCRKFYVCLYLDIDTCRIYGMINGNQLPVHVPFFSEKGTDK